jgi:hypothetical protein
MIGFILCVIFVTSLCPPQADFVIQLFSYNSKFHKGGSKRHKVIFEKPQESIEYMLESNERMSRFANLKIMDGGGSKNNGCDSVAK